MKYYVFTERNVQYAFVQIFIIFIWNRRIYFCIKLHLHLYLNTLLWTYLISLHGPKINSACICLCKYLFISRGLGTYIFLHKIKQCLLWILYLHFSYQQIFCTWMSLYEMRFYKKMLSKAEKKSTWNRQSRFVLITINTNGANVDISVASSSSKYTV